MSSPQAPCQAFGASDHCGVAVNVTLAPQRDRPFYRTFYRYDRADWTGLCNHLGQINWSEVFLGAVDEVWEIWRSLVVQATSDFIPSKRT